ncbi:MAG: hypothetical protein NXH71_07660 [Erythrobacteraceae bacterium]|nr:hypothetical protein [Erythrobacteraceae bacterium]
MQVGNDDELESCTALLQAVGIEVRSLKKSMTARVSLLESHNIIGNALYANASPLARVVRCLDHIPRSRVSGFACDCAIGLSTGVPPVMTSSGHVGLSPKDIQRKRPPEPDQGS